MDNVVLCTEMSSEMETLGGEKVGMGIAGQETRSQFWLSFNGLFVLHVNVTDRQLGIRIWSSGEKSVVVTQIYKVIGKQMAFKSHETNEIT